MRNLVVIIFILFFKFSGFGQNNIPQDYFVLPINPGQITSLSGCFGDLRINHFHAGLDIRTGGVEGKRVVAAADGYVSRIKIQNGGYGNALYITHPNGYTTVYAHLRDYNDELQQYITDKQYNKKTWEIDETLEPNKFKYKQGELVAFSGNTGGSGGPHLHFEIRDAKENAVDPALFGFGEIRDNVPPVIELVTLKCMSENALINGKFGTFDFKPVKKGNAYVLPNIKAKGTIGVEILTYDKAQNSPFRLGVQRIELLMNGKQQYSFKIDKMPFHNKLDMNVHVNYGRMIKNNLKIHKCYVDEANSLSLYESNDLWGKLNIENSQNNIELIVQDTYKNTSALKFIITKDQANTTSETTSRTSTEVLDGYLKVNALPTAKELRVSTSSREFSPQWLPSALGTKTAIIDMDYDFPTSIKLDGNDISLPVNVAVTLEQPNIDIQNLKANFHGTLYDNAFINVDVSDDALVLHQDVIPLKSHAEIQWTKNARINYPEKQKVYLEGSKRKFIGGEWTGQTIKFKTREFGTYVTLFDFEPPTITARTLNQDNLRFTISDKISGIKSIECFVDGQWVLMDYEYKTGAIWARKQDKSKPFQGNLVLKVTDNCNNTQSYETTIP